MQHVLIPIFSVGLLLLALGVLVTKDLLTCIIISSVFSLFAVVIYITMMAIDVAITEAAVGSAMSTVVYLLAFIAMKRAGVDIHNENINNHHKSCYNPLNIIVTVIGCLVLVKLLYSCLSFTNGDTVTTVYNASKMYLANAKEDFGIPNIVTAILAGYRAFDTMLETIVIFTAAFGVRELLRN